MPDDYNILISYTAIYKIYNKIELKDLIKYVIKEFGIDCNLNWIDVSNITDMAFLFKIGFNGDISKWNVSNVTSMKGMFIHSEFNGDISNWNINKVNNMAYMFSGSKFNRDISNWNAEHAYTYNMFDDCHIKAEYKPKNIYGY